MKKIVINTAIGGFGLSRAAYDRLIELGHSEEEYPDYLSDASYCYDIKRDDPQLVQIIEELGSEACSGTYCRLKIVEIPDEVDWDIGSADTGREWVYEKHRTWE